MHYKNIFKILINRIVYLNYYPNVHSIYLECPTLNLKFHKCFISMYDFNDNMCY